MIRRWVWLVTTLVVVALGAAGLYANHEAGQNVPTTDPLAGVQPPAGVDKETTIAAAPTNDKRPSDDGVGKSLAKAEVAPTNSDKALSDASLQKKEDGGAAPTPAKLAPPSSEPDPQATKPPKGNVPKPAEGNVPAHSPALQHPHRYGDRESYEGVPPSQAPSPSHVDRYGSNHESYEGVPPGQAPETRGGAGRGN